ncbi:MAG: glycosyltransferase [Chitinophagaceae bacterium]
MLIISIAIFLLVVYSLLIIYYRQSWIEAPEYKPGNAPVVNSLPYISVIIPARNEELNLPTCIESILKQDYPKACYEVIVADDFSEDATVKVVQDFKLANVQVLKLSEHINSRLNSYKKVAIKLAIDNCKGELVVTTDADCIVPPTWLSTIAAFYSENDASFIASPVAYHKEKNFLSIFQSLDFMTLQGITGASVYRKIYAMCNGANLAYKKSVFYAVNGFEGIDDIASGDDMLLMHKIQKSFPGEVFYLKSNKAIVNTDAMPTLSSFFNQRIRWASKTGKYQEKKLVIVLMLVYAFNVWFLVLGIAGIFSITALYWFLGLLVVKTIVELFYLYPVATFFGKRKLLWWFPAAQPFHILYTIIAGWLGRFGTYRWKGRKVK